MAGADPKAVLDALSVPFGDLIAAVGRGVAEAQRAMDAASIAALQDSEENGLRPRIPRCELKSIAYALPWTGRLVRRRSPRRSCACRNSRAASANNWWRRIRAFACRRAVFGSAPSNCACRARRRSSVRTLRWTSRLRQAGARWGCDSQPAPHPSRVTPLPR